MYKLVNNPPTMFKFYILFALVAYQKVFAQFDQPTGDYYWREYDGTIPVDALPSVQGDVTIYIGQGMTRDGNILVGAIVNGSTTLSVVETLKNDTIYDLETDIKILCTLKPTYFSWVSNLYEVKSEIFHVYGGVKTPNRNFPHGSLSIARPLEGTYETGIGYRDRLNDDSRMSYIVYNSTLVNTLTRYYEELYYTL